MLTQMPDIMTYTVLSIKKFSIPSYSWIPSSPDICNFDDAYNMSALHCFQQNKQREFSIFSQIFRPEEF